MLHYVACTQAAANLELRVHVSAVAATLGYSEYCGMLCVVDYFTNHERLLPYKSEPLPCPSGPLR